MIIEVRLSGVGQHHLSNCFCIDRAGCALMVATNEQLARRLRRRTLIGAMLTMSAVCWKRFISPIRALAPVVTSAAGHGATSCRLHRVDDARCCVLSSRIFSVVEIRLQPAPLGVLRFIASCPGEVEPLVAVELPLHAPGSRHGGPCATASASNVNGGALTSSFEISGERGGDGRYKHSPALNLRRVRVCASHALFGQQCRISVRK